MLKINQIMPQKLVNQMGDLDSYLKKELSPLITKTTWMTSWEQMAQRFMLNKFIGLSNEEILSYQWDAEKVERIITETFKEVGTHLKFDEVTVTVFPALPFSLHKNLDQSMWTNGFTNGPNSIQIAIPPNPNEDFLRYLIAHELHHATPENPIYSLALDQFSLAHWLKMEGGAELFSLSLYKDHRWWKNEFKSEVESNYWNRAKEKLSTTDSKEKSILSVGDPAQGLPVMVGYSFAYRLFSNYIEKYPNVTFRELLTVDPMEVIQVYEGR